MNVLLLGSGGREHALAWKLAQSPSLTRLYAAPGNPGIAQSAELVAIDVTDHAAVIAFCAEKAIELVVIGPEAPLVDGLGNSLRAAGNFPVSRALTGHYPDLVRALAMVKLAAARANRDLGVLGAAHHEAIEAAIARRYG